MGEALQLSSYEEYFYVSMSEKKNHCLVPLELLPMENERDQSLFSEQRASELWKPVHEVSIWEAAGIPLPLLYRELSPCSEILCFVSHHAGWEDNTL